MRLLCGLIAGKGVRATLTGDASLSTRPMRRVAEPLALLGANVRTTDGTAPLIGRTCAPARLHCGNRSRQRAGQERDFACGAGRVGRNDRPRTRKVARSQRTPAVRDGSGYFRSSKRRTHPKEPFALRGRGRSRGYFQRRVFSGAGRAERGDRLSPRRRQPTRTGILTAFDRLGVIYTLQNERLVCGEPVADIVVKKSAMRAITLSKEIMPALIDEIPVIALLCAFAEGESVISGAQELKVKESDRIATTAEMIAALGGDIRATDDGFVIRGKSKLQGGKVRSYGDHRIAMTAAIGLAASENGGAIEGAECVNISFPDFYRRLAGLGN